MGVSKSCAVPMSTSSVLVFTGTGKKLTGAGANKATKFASARESPQHDQPVSGPVNVAEALPGTTKNVGAASSSSSERLNVSTHGEVPTPVPLGPQALLPTKVIVEAVYSKKLSAKQFGEAPSYPAAQNTRGKIILPICLSFMTATFRAGGSGVSAMYIRVTLPASTNKSRRIEQITKYYVR